MSIFHGYRKLEKESHTPAVPFGFGLSYTQFEVAKPQAWKKKIRFVHVQK